MGHLSEELIERIWSEFFQKQQSINRQLKESEEKYHKRLEESNRLIEISEKKFFRRMEEKKRQIDETNDKAYQQYEENRIKYESNEEQKTNKRLKSKESKKKANDSIKTADHPVYSAIIDFFNKKGYQFDNETLEQYWKLITLVTRSENLTKFPDD